jgi:Magnesium chelatase, subunit ChlI
MSALVGGGLRARPGEISLGNNGVLFLDELPEFSGQVLDSLRQPLETGEVALSRGYPARFMLIAAMNPCCCGRASDPGFICKRGQNMHCAPEPTAGCRARWSTGRPHKCTGERGCSRGGRTSGLCRLGALARCCGLDAPDGAWISPDPAGRAHARRSRQSRACRTRCISRKPCPIGRSPTMCAERRD